MEVFAVAAPGLERVVAEELRALGLAGAEVAGGVEFEGDERAVWRANLWSRIATRILVRAGSARATSFARLRAFVAGLPWERFVGAPVKLEIAATAHRSRLYHTGAIAERVRGGVGDRLGAAAVEGEAPLRLVVRAEDDVFTVSVDSSGELLHRRGYRAAAGEAPLRETLAAGILALARWRADEPLVDPTCGSGTFVVEAALAATGRAPGARRDFGFESWPGFDAAAFARLRAEARPRRAPAPLVGLDRDPAAVDLARAAAARAGVEADVELRCVEARNATLPDGPRGLVVANPPYGRRLPATSRLYRAIGELARRGGWRLALLTPDAGLAALAGRFVDRVPLANGGMRVWLHLSE